LPRADSGTGEGTWRRRAPIAVAIVLVLAAAAVYAATASPLFRARTLNVEGTGKLGRAQILHLAQIDTTTNILWLSGSTVSGRLMASPWVRSATVTKSYPSTLTISVVERSAVAATESGDSWLALAADGTALELLKKMPPGLPLIVGAASPAIGRLSAETTPAATAVGLMNEETRSQVEKVVVAPDGTLRLFLVGGGRVEYGEAVELKDKADSLSGILSWAQENHSRIRTVDLTAPAAPAAKVTKTAST